MSWYLRLTLLTILILPITPCTAVESLSFEKGLQAFSKKDYLRAIYYFDQAKKQTPERNTIYYNLGVSHFKLKHYPQAEASFRVALRSEKLRQLVQYNLGLVKLKQRQTAEAQRWFDRAKDKRAHPRYFNQKIYMLAATINQTPNRTKVVTAATPFKFNAGANLAYGYDSNVTQTGTGSPSTQPDHFSESFAYLHFSIPYTQLKLTYYGQDFKTINTSDYQQLETKLEFPIRIDNWTITPAWSYTPSQLDKQDYQSVTEASFDLKYHFTKKDSLLFKYRHSDIEIDNPLYNYLTGTQQRFRTELINETFLGQFRLRYDYEYNNRQNDLNTMLTPNTLTDYSPTRHSLRLRLKNSLSQKIKIKNEFSYRHSLYHEDSNGLRKDNRKQYQLNLYTPLFSNMELGVKYLYTKNNSSLTTENYTRRITLAYLYLYF